MEVKSEAFLENFKASIPSTAEEWMVFFKRHINAEMPDAESEVKELSDRIDYAVVEIFYCLLQAGVLVAQKPYEDVEEVEPKDVQFSEELNLNQADRLEIGRLIEDLVLTWREISDDNADFQIQEVLIIFQTLRVPATARNRVRQLMKKREKETDTSADVLLRGVSANFTGMVGAFAVKVGHEGGLRSALELRDEAAKLTSEAFGFPASASAIARYFKSGGKESSHHNDETFKRMIGDLDKLLRARKLLSDSGFVPSFVLNQQELAEIDEALSSTLIAYYVPGRGENSLEKIAHMIEVNLNAAKVGILVARVESGLT